MPKIHYTSFPVASPYITSWQLPRLRGGYRGNVCKWIWGFNPRYAHAERADVEPIQQLLATVTHNIIHHENTHCILHTTNIGLPATPHQSYIYFMFTRTKNTWNDGIEWASMPLGLTTDNSSHSQSNSIQRTTQYLRDFKFIELICEFR